MALTVVVLSGAVAPGGELSLTLDAPRIVIGRAEGCDVRLPDVSVSHRHASIRQEGSRYFLVDENSLNGTFLGRTRLPPQTPHAVNTNDLARIGGVALRFRIGPGPVGGNVAGRAKELALALVVGGMQSQGQDARPRVVVLHGALGARSLLVDEPGRPYVLGGSPQADLVLNEPGVASAQARLMRRGDVLDLSAKPTGLPVVLDGMAVGPHAVSWRPGQVLVVGNAHLMFEFPAASALRELERCADEGTFQDEAAEPIAGSQAVDATGPVAPGAKASSVADAACGSDLHMAADLRDRPRSPLSRGSWGLVDVALVLVALGVFGLSVAGAWWLFGK
jgi:pSer/pThr/pTyr-binding forkhead associated (FHA) protein